NHSFVRFDYFSPVAELHWYVVATQIRCHIIQFVFAGRDTKLMESLIEEMDKMKLPAEASPILGTGGDDVPVCIKDYAGSESVVERVDPIFTERRFNPIPVRIIIGKDGKVKHIHFLGAFPDQAKSITEALSQWRFKPYLRDGQPTEVETGIMFGRAPGAMKHSAADAVNE
ncbi:MAG TPA: energy transducer TonB, partial [Verrucomicrobiae bacterium]|nr:energy transducer TonB [Verrucomicrobiae bacterium]